MSSPGSSVACERRSMIPSAPDPTITSSNATPACSASAERSAKAPPSGYRLSSRSPRSIASSAAGNGGNGPSFDASFTTRSSPSSRCTASTGLPGSYGTRSAIDARKRLSFSAPGTGKPGAVALCRAPSSLRSFAAGGQLCGELLRLLPHDDPNDLQREEPDDGVALVHD